MINFIEEVDVTLVKLSVELERAVIEHNLDEDGNIYVKEDGWHPYAINIDNAAGLIRFSTFATFASAVSALKRLKLANQLNANNNLLTACIFDGDDCLTIDYSLIFRDGLLRESFIRTCRQFCANVKDGLKEIDHDGALLLVPGEEESGKID